MEGTCTCPLPLRRRQHTCRLRTRTLTLMKTSPRARTPCYGGQRRRRRSDGHNGGLPAAAPRVHEPDTSHNISGVVADNTIRAFNRTRMPHTLVHTGTRTGIHAPADTHTHTHARTAHHVDSDRVQREPTAPQIAVRWSGDGYGHVLWPPRTSTTSAVPKTSTETCRTRTPMHDHGDHHAQMQNDHTRTHGRVATHAFSVA